MSIPIRYAPAAALALCLAATASFAETLQIFRGDPAKPITLAPGATVVVNSATPFYENAVASPVIAQHSTQSDQVASLTGNREGRTTLTLLHEGEGHSVTQVDILVTPNADSIVLQGDEAASLPPNPLPPTPAPQVVEVVNGVAVKDIPLAAHQAIVLKTDLPFTKVVSGDTSISAASVLWDGNGAYILGMSAGATPLTLSRDGAAEDTVLNIVVNW